MEILKKDEVDWSGQKYLLLKDRGHDVNIYFNRISKDKNNAITNTWYSRCHSISDGVGAFSDLQSTLSGERWQQPHNQKIPRPNLLKQLWQLLKYLWSHRPIEYRWRFNKQQNTSLNQDYVATINFSQKSTEELLAWAKLNKISLNSLLLWSLDKSTRSLLLVDNNVRAWLIPVNMRGGLTLVNPSFNYTASLNLRLQNKGSSKGIEELTVRDFDNKIKNLYSQGQQWGSWLYSNFSKYIPLTWSNRFIKNYKSCWLGVFSNLGTWSNPQETPLDESVQWGVVSPATPFNPVASVALTWNNQLTLSLRIHPSKLKEENIAQELNLIAQEWSQLLVKECQVLQEPRITITNLHQVSKNCVNF